MVEKNTSLDQQSFMLGYEYPLAPIGEEIDMPSYNKGKELHNAQKAFYSINSIRAQELIMDYYPDYPDESASKEDVESAFNEASESYRTYKRLLEELPEAIRNEVIFTEIEGKQVNLLDSEIDNTYKRLKELYSERVEKVNKE